MPRNTSVTLGLHFDEFVENQINKGRYQSVSEVIRAALRKLEEDEAKLDALRTALEAGEKSPAINDFDPEQMLSELHGKSA